MINEWEKQTGQSWPRYEADVYNPKTGILIARKGAEYQAHHINPQQLGGKHEWWNMHPVHVDQHQGGIHGSGSVLGKIIKGMNE